MTKRSPLLIAAFMSASILLVVLAFWMRSYTTGRSASWWGPVRVEVWSDCGQFGLYVSENHFPSMSLVTTTAYDIRPLDTQSWKYGGGPAVIPPDKRVFKGFEFRLIDGRYPEVELPCWFVAGLMCLVPVGVSLLFSRKDQATPASGS